MSMAAKPHKRRSLDMLDFDIEPDNVIAGLPCSPSHLIHLKSHRLKSKIQAMQHASRFAKVVQETDNKKPKDNGMHIQMYKPPDCLKDVIAKIAHEKKERREHTTPEVDK